MSLAEHFHTHSPTRNCWAERDTEHKKSGQEIRRNLKLMNDEYVISLLNSARKIISGSQKEEDVDIYLRESSSTPGAEGSVWTLSYTE